jgi:hypothetical protein
MRSLTTLAAAAGMTAALMFGAQAQSSNDASTSRAPGGAVTNGTANPPSTNGQSSRSNNGMSSQPGSVGGSTTPPAAGPRVGPNATSDVPPNESRTGTGRGQ